MKNTVLPKFFHFIPKNLRKYSKNHYDGMRLLQFLAFLIQAVLLNSGNTIDLRMFFSELTGEIRQKSVSTPDLPPQKKRDLFNHLPFEHRLLSLAAETLFIWQISGELERTFLRKTCRGLIAPRGWAGLGTHFTSRSWSFVWISETHSKACKTRYILLI